MAGCSGGDSATADLEKKIEALEKENAELKAALGNLDAGKADAENKENAGNDSAGKSEEKSDKEAAPAAKGKVIEAKKPLEIADFAELTIQGAKFANKITPPNPDSFYSYYEVKDASNTYFDTVIKVKSLLTEGKSADEFVSVKVVYDNKYEYNAFSTIEDKGGADFTYTNITSIEPLKTGTLHFIAEVPAEVAKDKKPIQVVVSVNGEDYTYTYR
ncbi:phage lipoprotein [Paenibacillus dendritiformis]|nr:phage lipoprotein [Paenibacillus dendritiformis]